MKFKVPKSILDKAIRSVSRAIPNKSIQPILNNILLENINDSLYLKATDLDLYIEAIVPSNNESEGSITLSARKLEEIVSRLEENDVEISVDLENQKTSINCQKANFDLVGVSSEEFPKFNKPSEDNEYILINKNKFLKIIDMVSFSSSKYDVNSILGGVFMGFLEKNAHFIFDLAATDGNRLSSFEIEVEAINLKQKEAVVPIKVIQDVSKILETSVDENLKISFRSNQIIFKTEDRLIISRLLDGVYPKYKQLIPSEFDKFAQVNRKDLLSVLDRVSVMANEITNLVHLNFSENKLIVKSSNKDFGGAEDLLDIEYMGDEIDIFFNVKYLLEGLKNMDSDQIQVSLIGSVSPMMIKPISNENYLYLVMPIKHKVNS
jgi:DNA polymerase III subunit beta